MSKIRLTKIRVAIILIVAFIAIVFGCTLSMILPNPEYADFTRFSTTTDVETYWKSKLQVGESTKALTSLLLSELDVKNCSEYISTNGIDISAGGVHYDSLLLCRANAPRQWYTTPDWFSGWFNSILIRWFYDTNFYFLGDTLIGIEVRMNDMSL